MELKQGNTTVELVEENGVVRVNIKSDDAVVFLNNEMIYSIGNDVEEFKYIAPKFHKFLLDSGMDYIEYSEKHKETTVDCYPNGETLTFYFPLNKNEKIRGRLDLITNVEGVESYLLDFEDEENIKETIEELKTRFENVIEFVESKGYRFHLSHKMGDWAYAWWDIVFTVSNFDETSIREIVDKVKEFNDYIYELREKYQI